MTDETAKKKAFEAFILKLEEFENATEASESLDKYQTLMEDAIDELAKISNGKINRDEGKRYVKDILESIKKERDNPKDNKNEDLRHAKFELIWSWTRIVAIQLNLIYDFDDNGRCIIVDVTLGLLSSEAKVEYKKNSKEGESNEDSK